MYLLSPGAGGSVLRVEGAGRVLHADGRRDQTAENVAWYYPKPTPAFAPIAGYVAFYPGPMDRCTVGGDMSVTPQAGRVLRRVGHVGRGRPVQGRAGVGRVVGAGGG